MCPKSKQEPRGKQPKNPSSGIPRLLAAIKHEKISEVIPVKVPYSLKIYLRQRHNPVSTWVRAAILEKLEREANPKC